MSETTVFQPDHQQELNDCNEFAEMLCTTYEPAENGGDTVFTMLHLIDRFNQAYTYTPEPESLKNAMVNAGFIFSLVPLDDDFKVGFAVKMK